MFLVLLSTAVCVAQNAKNSSDIPNFSGRWVSESVKMHVDSPRPFRNADADFEIKLVIVQSGNELRVKEAIDGSRGSSSRDVIYYLDGRGETNKGFTDEFIYESKTVLKDNKLFIEMAIRSPNSKVGPTQAEEWELSADGKTLIIRTKSSGSGSPTVAGARWSTIRYEKVFRLAS